MVRTTLITDGSPSVPAGSWEGTVEQKLATLTGSQRKRLEKLLESRASKPRVAADAALKLPRKPGNNEFSCSFAQERLWFLDQVQPSLYNLQGALRILGPLNIEWLRLAFREIVSRHENLRTTFHPRGASPVQVVHAQHQFDVPLLDLEGIAESERKQEIDRLVYTELRWKFNLAAGPLLRASLVRLDERTHILIYTLHHIVADGWSLGVLNREITALYNAKGDSRVLAALPIQYGDYAQWQRSQWEKGKWDEHRDYWIHQLKGAPERVALMLDKPRPDTSAFAGSKAAMDLDPTCVSRIKALCQAHETTLFTFLFAVFNVLLYKFSGQKDLVVGTPTANRHSREEEELIGFFVNLLPLRTSVGGDVSFTAFLARVKQTVTAALTHQQYPFDRIVEQLTLECGRTQSPLFQIIFELNNNPVRTLTLSELSFESLDTEVWAAAYELRFSLYEFSGGLRVDVVYDNELFSCATIDRYLEGYRLLLESVLTEPRQLIRELSAMSAAAAEQIRLWRTSSPSVHSSATAVFIDWFEAAARRHAQNIAVSDDCGGSMTYEDLDGRAAELAARLRRAGSQPEMVIGIFLNRSLDFITALLGVFKAGAAYLPIDPGYPAERIQYLLDDALVPLVVTNRKLFDRLPVFAGTVLFVDDPDPMVRPAPARAPVLAENMAYVLYTSGSSGKPKGVIVSHGALWNYVEWAVGHYGLEHGSGTLVHSSPSFDLTLTGLLPPLITGKQISLITADESWRDLSARFEVSRDLTLVKLTPSHLELMAHLQPTRPEGCARALVIGGEALHYEQLQYWRGNAPSTVLYNEYGPTETVVGSSVYQVKPDDPSTGSVPIGRPIARVELFVLDEDGEHVPVRTVGELFIGGPSLARGYMGRPDLTAKVFLPNPWATVPGSRFYQTGDWVCWREDGELIYFGRKDGQLKLRGMRVELDEVQYHLRNCPSVEQAVVTVDTDDSGREVRLTAYYVGSPGYSESDPAAFLQERIPRNMIPERFVRVDAIPLTPNGKVDIAALRRLVPAAASARGECIVPETPLQEIVLGIWKEVLGTTEIGLDDNFFQLGGYSLLIAQIIARLADISGATLSVNAFYEDPTVRGVTGKLEVLRRGALDALPPLRRVSRREPQPLSFAQERLWFLQAVDATTSAYNIPCLLKISGPLSIAVLRQCIAELGKRHESFRTIFPEIDGQPRQRILEEPAVEVAVVDLTDRTEGELEMRRQASDLALRAFDLRTGPMVRVAVFVLGKEEFALLFVMHHIISDARSIEILLGEMETLYAECQGQRPCTPLRENPFEYMDYGAWQREFLDSKHLDVMLDFWGTTLGDYRPGNDLPYDVSRSDLRSDLAGFEPVLFDAELTASLRALSQAAGATLFMTVLAAFKVLLHLHTGRSDMLVAVPVSTRRGPDTAGIIGLFLNQILVRSLVTTDGTVLECLTGVRDRVLAAFDHQDLPFEKVVERLLSAGKLGEAPLTQVMFNFLHQPAKTSLDLGGLKIENVALQQHYATMDLKLVLTESGDAIRGGFEYKCGLFRPETIRRLAGDLQTVARFFAQGADAVLAELSLVTAEEEQELEDLESATALNFE